MSFCFSYITLGSWISANQSSGRRLAMAILVEMSFLGRSQRNQSFEQLIHSIMQFPQETKRKLCAVQKELGCRVLFDGLPIFHELYNISLVLYLFELMPFIFCLMLSYCNILPCLWVVCICVYMCSEMTVTIIESSCMVFNYFQSFLNRYVHNHSVMFMWTSNCRISLCTCVAGPVALI